LPVVTLAMASLLLVGSSRPTPAEPGSEVVRPAEQLTQPSPIRAHTAPESVAMPAPARQRNSVAMPQRPNPLRRAVGKLWWLGRHKKSSAGRADNIPVTETPR